MKLLLINPGILDDAGNVARVALDAFPGLTLPYLAGLLPSRHQLRLINDEVEEVDFSELADAVMLTGMTSRSERAYQIADGFRARGAKVVMGGIHATLYPEEAGEHVDAVAVGEAEGLIEELMDDLEAGRLKSRYEAATLLDLSGLPMPRYDLIKADQYLVQTDPVQVVRGCPHRCRYCSVHLVQGSRLRRRPIADVLRDLSGARRMLSFVDDNIMADRAYAMELFRAMKPLGKIWGAQSDISFGVDPEMVAAAREAGCVMLFIGLETLDQESLTSMNKRVNTRTDMGRALDNLRHAGIGVLASFMVGFDRDTPAAMDDLLAFLEEHRVPALFLFALTPFPRTAFRADMEEQGRVFDCPWRKYDGSHVVFRPKLMAPDELLELYWETYRRFYSIRGIARRLMWPPRLFPALFNLVARRGVNHRIHPLTGYPANFALASRAMVWALENPLLRTIGDALGR